MTQFGKIVLIVQNDHKEDENFNIKFAGKTAAVTIPGHSAATYIF
jgi:glucosylceramidase